jgi:hypothetical protein
MWTASAVVREGDEDEQDLEEHRGHGEEVQGDEASEVVVEERAPRLRRRRSTADQVLGDRGLGDLEAELLEFACVQSNADVFSGGSPAGARASSPVGAADNGRSSCW